MDLDVLRGEGLAVSNCGLLSCGATRVVSGVGSGIMRCHDLAKAGFWLPALPPSRTTRWADDLSITGRLGTGVGVGLWSDARVPKGKLRAETGGTV